jgi:copper homeostasis protein
MSTTLIFGLIGGLLVVAFLAHRLSRHTRGFPALAETSSVKPSAVLLEVCVESVASAVAAERGGAHRVELCANLAVDGVTPPRKLIEEVRRRISIPLHVLIRPRDGDFNYTPTEFEAMKTAIARAKEMRVDGVVLGILNAAQQVDIARTRELVELSRPLAVTFHRAFDETADLPSALEAVVQTGANRVLTSGSARNADEGSSMLAQLVEQSAGRVTILACGTIRETNVRKLVHATGVCEVHASLLARPAAASNEVPLDLQPETVDRFLRASSEVPENHR